MSEAGEEVVTVKGVGVDVVDVERFGRILERSPGVMSRTLLPAERLLPSGEPRSPASLAARFAGKEAVAKALGAPAGWQWLECEIVTLESGQPTVVLTGSLSELARARGIDDWQISLSHDGGLATAFVVASGLR